MKSYRKVTNAGAISMNIRGEIVGTVYNKSVVWWGQGLHPTALYAWWHDAACQRRFMEVFSINRL